MREVVGMLGGGVDLQSMGHNIKPLRLGNMQTPFVSLKPRKLLADLATIPKWYAVSDLSKCVASSFLFPPLAL